MVVWIAADKVYPGRKFLDYGVLGDDIVITDERVAAEYRRILDILQVNLSEQKSLASYTGCAEFAKRFVVKGLSKDISPIDIRSLLSCHHRHLLS